MDTAPGSASIGGLTVTSVIDGFGETNAAEFWNAVADATDFDWAAHFPGLRFGRLLVGQGRSSWTTATG